MLTGLAVTAVTLLVLGVALEIAARLFVPETLFSPFKPCYAADPVVGFTLQPHWRGYTTGTQVAVNSHGYRGPEWPVAKPAGTVRIALIGDSHAFGFGVAFHDTVGEVLARALSARTERRCEVLNFGIPAHNSRQQLATLEHRALPFGPDLVVVLPCDNDHERPLWADEEGYLHWAPAGEKPPEHTRLDTEPFVRWPHSAFLRQSRAYMYVKLLWARILHRREIERGAPPRHDAGWQAPPLPSAPPPDELREPVYEPLLAMRRLCDGRGVPMVIAGSAATLAYRTLYAAFARETGTPVVELMRLFPEAHGWGDLLAKFSLGWDSHLGPEAHRRWGEAIAELIVQHRLLDG